MGIVFTFAQANSRILCKFFNKKAFALECYFRYNNSSISLQNGQTFLPTAKRVDYILRSQPFFMTIECSQSVHSIVMGFILLRVLEFSVFRKMEMPETKNHLLCGWRQSVVQKNHLSVTIELFRHYCKKGKVILWRIRIMI